MTPRFVTIYCLPNIRRPWVLVFEPHPWGRGALRVSQDKAVPVYERLPTEYELRWLEGSKTHWCFTFDTEERLLDYEDGQHDKVAEVKDAIAFRRQRVDAVLAEIESKRAAKAREERKRGLLRMANEAAKAADEEEDDDGPDGPDL